MLAPGRRGFWPGAEITVADALERLDELKTPYEQEVRDVPSDAVVAALLEQVAGDLIWGWQTWALPTFDADRRKLSRSRLQTVELPKC